ncbi:hypothetical protein AYO41_02780 [Verrucomicrobia bacterium SCGC AG-212-E04]|nr:hypothetical protein AYO41_02780 [Verrucomicrobia bacterium SCGC AG-212-E04]
MKKGRRRTWVPAPLRVRASAIHGRGVFAVGALPARCKLGEVTGERVALPAARHAVAAQPRIYLVELSRRYALDCSTGNHFRHLNHSCRPNCYLRVFRGRVEVYARAAIAAGTELTVDYGATPHAGGMACRCGAARCVGKL